MDGRSAGTCVEGVSICSEQVPYDERVWSSAESSRVGTRGKNKQLFKTQTSVRK